MLACIVILFWNRCIRCYRCNRSPCALAILYYSDLFYSQPITIPHFSKLCAITIRAHNTASVLNAQQILIRMPLKHTIQIWLRQSIKCIDFNLPLSFGHAITVGVGNQYII